MSILGLQPQDTGDMNSDSHHNLSDTWLDHEGSDFHSVLSLIHQLLNPTTYLEIGTCTGASLSKSSCASIAIDPNFVLDQDVIGAKPSCHLFRSTSDSFFRDHSPLSIFGKYVDMAFLDGLHYFEFLLRDFINIEQYCKRNSLVILHDCLPSDPHVARRRCEDQSLSSTSKHPTWWAGDLWKVIELLRSSRPELQITAYNSPPTGLVIITNLDKDSVLLRDNYYDLLRQGQLMDGSPAALRRYLDSLEIVHTKELMDYDSISRRYYL